MPDGLWTVDDHLRGQPASSVELFRAVEAAILACGPVRYAVSKTTVTFKGSRRGFAGARPDRHGVVGYLDLMRSLEGDPRVRNVSPYTSKLFVNQYRLRTLDEIDDTFVEWLHEAYAVGCGAHLA